MQEALSLVEDGVVSVEGSLRWRKVLHLAELICGIQPSDAGGEWLH